MRRNLQDLLDQLESVDEAEKLQHVLIGTPEDIQEAQHSLHALRYSDQRYWSPTIPMPGTSLSMSVLTRYCRRDSLS